MRPGACAPGSDIQAWDHTSNLCFVLSEQGVIFGIFFDLFLVLVQFGAGECPQGHGCDPTGMCVPSTLGEVCVDAGECARGNSCWVNPAGGPNVVRFGFVLRRWLMPLLQCCNQACNGECKECTTGTCTNRSGISCDVGKPIECFHLLAGWRGNTCERFDSAIDKRCDMTGYCSATAGLCAPSPGIRRTGAFVCGSAACKKACPLYTVVDSFTLSDACHLDRERPACPEVSCMQYLAGWLGPVRLRRWEVGF